MVTSGTAQAAECNRNGKRSTSHIRVGLWQLRINGTASPAHLHERPTPAHQKDTAPGASRKLPVWCRNDGSAGGSVGPEAAGSDAASATARAGAAATSAARLWMTLCIARTPSCVCVSAAFSIALSYTTPDVVQASARHSSAERRPMRATIFTMAALMRGV